MNPLQIQEVLRAALQEDIGMGDLTTTALFSEEQHARGSFISKADGVFVGASVLNEAYAVMGSDVSVHLYKEDGDLVAAGQIIAEVEGPVRTLLTAERVILNLVQHLSGIATATSDLILKLDDPSISLADTRKTLPGLRSLQKYAVVCGGGRNHRFRLDDGIMIKDNHIKAAGSISTAVERVKAKSGHMVKIVVETETKEQVLEAVAAGADVIMLDNRSPEEVKAFITLIPETIITEVSGGIGPDNIDTYKHCGADVISVGWLTHSVKALDISFNLTAS